MTVPAIRFDGVTRYFGAACVVNGVSLDIGAGSFVALVGQSGAGKSTLLKMVNRLVDPDAGTVLLDGVAVDADPPHMLRRRIGYVFQNVGLFPHLTVAQNIAIGLKIAGQAAGDRVGELLDLVDLPRDIALRRPDALSGGQCQRIGFARALATRPQLMLMDEPFGALDPLTRAQIGAAYRALNDRLNLTTVMVTHDMAEALLLADRILVMAAGRIVADATPAALLAGQAGAEADALVAVPRDQAERLHALGRGA